MQSPDQDPETIYHRWRYFDPIRKRKLTARYEASEAHAREKVERGEWVDPEPIPGTRIVRPPIPRDQWQTTGAAMECKA